MDLKLPLTDGFEPPSNSKVICDRPSPQDWADVVDRPEGELSKLPARMDDRRLLGLAVVLVGSSITPGGDSQSNEECNGIPVELYKGSMLFLRC